MQYYSEDWAHFQHKYNFFLNWRREQKNFYGRKKVQMDKNKKKLAVVVYGYEKQNHELTI